MTSDSAKREHWQADAAGACPMLVRAARLDDAADCAELHAQGFAPGWSAQDIGGWLARQDVLAAIGETEAGPGAFALVLAAGNEAELLTIASASNARRRGLARWVLIALDVECLSRGLVRWVLEVAADNMSALGLYRSLGFREIALRKGYYPRLSGPVDAIVMDCEVGFSARFREGQRIGQVSPGTGEILGLDGHPTR